MEVPDWVIVRSLVDGMLMPPAPVSAAEVMPMSAVELASEALSATAPPKIEIGPARETALLTVISAVLPDLPRRNELAVEGMP